MKNHKTALFLLAIASMGFANSGCSMFHHHQPKSSWKIIDEGDRNPFIVNQQESVQDTPTHRVEVETSPVSPQ